MLRKPGESIEEWQFRKNHPPSPNMHIRSEKEKKIRNNSESYEVPKSILHKQKVIKITGFKSPFNYNPSQISDEFKEKLKNNYLTEKDGYLIFKKLLRNEDIEDINHEIDSLIYKKFKIRYPKTCYNCYKELLENSNYCTYCGKKID